MMGFSQMAHTRDSIESMSGALIRGSAGYIDVEEFELIRDAETHTSRLIRVVHQILNIWLMNEQLIISMRIKGDLFFYPS